MKQSVRNEKRNENEPNSFVSGTLPTFHPASSRSLYIYNPDGLLVSPFHPVDTLEEPYPRVGPGTRVYADACQPRRQE